LASILSFAHAQDRNIYDSLVYQLNHTTFSDSSELQILNEITINALPEQAIQYGNRLLSTAKEQANNEYKAKAYHLIGVAYRQMGLLEEAQDYLFKSAEIAQANDLLGTLALTYMEIATSYTSNDDLRNALLYNSKAIEILRKTGNDRQLAIYLLNTGFDYYLSNELDTALSYFNEAEKIFIQDDFKIGLAYVTGNRALVYWKSGDRKTAESELLKAISILTPLGDHYGMADYHNQLGNIYLEDGDTKKAIFHTEEGMELAIKEGLKEQVRDASLLLSTLYKEKGDFQKALAFQTQYIAYKDSIQSQETTQRMADQRTDFEVGQKQAQLDLIATQQKAERERNYIIGAALLAVLLLILVIAYIQYRNSQQRKKINLQLALQKQELEQLNQTKDRFFSIISHDLRGPVNAFAGISKLIKMYLRKGKIDEINEMAGDIDESAGRLSNLLDNLLEWAVQQQGQFPYTPEKVNFRKITQELFSTFETTASGKEIKLYSKIEEDIFLFVDKNSTTTIFRNLVGNALKFTPEGGEVFFDARLNKESVLLSVNDTGVGIPEEKLDQLFTLSEKKSTWGTAGEKGLGLGLQLAYEFTEMNKGIIKVESQEGQGTRFIIELPLFESVKETTKGIA
ncbi:MAG: tetratricopeptide repeat-containing sensor histidine kinase, partial [Cyclobacteriaceae bacterium]